MHRSSTRRGAAVLAMFVLAGCDPNAFSTILIAARDAGGGPEVREINSRTQQTNRTFLAFDSDFTGGVRVAVGDVNGDGASDLITGAGPGGGPHVRVFSGKDQSVLHDFLAFDASFTGGVYVAAGDVNGDGYEDVVVGADEDGAPQVKVFSGATGDTHLSFFAFSPSFSGGVRVAAGDVNGDGKADIIAGAGPGGGPQVKVFSGEDQSVLHDLFAFDAGFTGGVYVATGDVNGDGHDDVITGAGFGGQPEVKAFDGTDGNTLHSFFAFDADFTGGVRVAAGDVNGDGFADIITGAGPGGGPRIRIFSPESRQSLGDFFAYDTSFTGGVFVAAAPAASELSDALVLARLLNLGR